MFKPVPSELPGPHPSGSQPGAIKAKLANRPKLGRILVRTVYMSGSIVIFTVAIFLTAVFPYQRRQLVEEMLQRAMVVQSSTAQVLEEAIVLDDFSAVVDHCISIVSQNPSLRYVVITPKDGMSLIHTADAWQQQDLEGMWKPVDNQIQSNGHFMPDPFKPGESFHISYPLNYTGYEWGWIHLGLSTDKFRKDLKALYQRSGMIAALAISIGLVLSLIYARRLSVPILKLEHFARRIATGDLSQRITIRSGDEVEHLAQAFNFMVDELERAKRERETAQKKLVETARQAGMAEMVSNVLHNVGNVLNSVGVTTSTMQQRITKSKMASLSQLATMLQDQGGELPHFLTADPRGQKVPSFLFGLADHLGREQGAMAADIAALERHVQHMRDIIHLQQDYSRTRGLTESVSIADVIEDALRLNSEQNAKYGITIHKEYASVPDSWVDRHRLLQILINLLSNARHALMQSDNLPKVIRIILEQNHTDHIRITVADNGIGIASENLTRIFQHGFTTRKEGHGFGLHSSAIAAQELSGSLTVTSEGIGRGAAFFLELPFRPLEESHAV